MRSCLKQLQSHPLFEGIQEERLSAMLACLGGYRKTYQKGEIIFLSEEPVKSVGIVIHGRIRMTKEYDNGDVSMLMNIEQGELLGETFACGSFLNSKVVFQAAVSSEVLFLPFYKVIHTCNMTCGFHHRLIENMVRLISDKNVQLIEKMEATSRKSLRDKILTYLFNQAEKRNSWEFEIPLSRGELAEYLCADRSALTRELSHMREDGLIVFQKNRFRIVK
ncbi:MAG: Crp/Fnr family transcriptional regulator [Firmicutes bacterium]|nr:Crp/Fnr family transcriptional regulator [Bacillota bacterium]NBI62667.1 Crp/Fnr family transcriptional regulator [Clostridiales bacterium]